MTRKLFLGALLACLCGAIPAFAADEAAAKAVEAWLIPHDEGRYDETWEATAEFVKEKLPREQWEKLMQSALEPFGKVESRSLHSSSPTTELPGMPDGQYFVFQYKTRFEKKQSSIETIIPMVEDGEWKVMTYRVQ